MSESASQKLLEDFGLSPAEAEILGILLHPPSTSMTGNEVAQKTEITRYYVFALLSRLVQKGFAAEVPERPRRYYSTLDMLRRTIESQEDDMNIILQAIDESRDDPSKFFQSMGYDDEIALGYSILQEGPASRNELVTRATHHGIELSYEQIRRITDNLVNRRYVEKLARGRTFYYHSADLKEIIDREKSKLLKDWEERKIRLLEHLDTLSQILGISLVAMPARIDISVLRDRRAISRRTLSESLKAREVLCAQFVRLPNDPESYAKQVTATFFNYVEMVEKGIKVRCLANDATVFFIASISPEILTRLLSNPSKFSMKLTSQALCPSAIIDDSTVFEFPSTGKKPFDSAILLRGTEIAKYRREEFLEVWNQSEDIRPYIRPLLNPALQSIIDDSMEGSLYFDFKIIICGQMGIGKTSLVRRFCFDKFIPQVKATVTAEINSRIISLSRNNGPDIDVNLHIWDFSGDEKYRIILEKTLIGANGIIFAVDLTDDKSLKAIHEWISFTKFKGQIPVVLVATKNDLESEITVSKERLEDFARELGFQEVFLASSKNNNNVETPFNRISELIVDFFETEGFLPSLSALPPLKSHQGEH
ncbi:MAG: GTP-binding protein [Candidatus Hodarchaeota archaeon]